MRYCPNRKHVSKGRKVAENKYVMNKGRRKEKRKEIKERKKELGRTQRPFEEKQE
jgi:hypothetical protein